MRIDAFRFSVGLLDMVALVANDAGQQYALGFVSSPYEGQPYSGCVWHEEDYSPVAAPDLAAALGEVAKVTGLEIPQIWARNQE